MTLRTANPHALNGAQLKAIAMVTMLIDHMAVVFLEQLYPYVVDMAVFDTQTIVYITMRLIGRLAFPIFAYLLVVGFYHTKNIKNMHSGWACLLSFRNFRLTMPCWDAGIGAIRISFHSAYRPFDAVSGG